MILSRRDFLRQLSAAGTFGVVHLGLTPGRDLRAQSAGDLLPEPDDAALRELALVAVDAARSAGAGFADVRVTGMRSFSWRAMVSRESGGQRPSMGVPNLAFTTSYGIRAVVDGAWGFAGGQTVTWEAVSDVALRAVGRARANRPRQARRLELAPVPRVENGIWAPPIEEDPFAVPVGEQADLALAALTAAEGVWGVLAAEVAMGWGQTLNVFASSEGSLIVQRLTRGGADASASGRSRDNHAVARERVLSLRNGWYGYEAISPVDLVAELREAAERAVANSRPAVETASSVSVDVGRYDLVLSGPAVLDIMQATLAPALNLERALGYLANREGTSFAAPPAEILGKYKVGSPLLTLRADRTRPHCGASVGWDDEGVQTGEHTLIEDGVIVDYLTSRQTAVELAALYEARSDAVRSRGCMRGNGDRRPEIHLPNLTIEAGREDVSIDDLIADTKRGICIRGNAPGSSDQQLFSGQFGGIGVYEIRNGKLGRRLKDFAFQILTPQFWKNLDAIGGPATIVESNVVVRNPGSLWERGFSYSVRGPAARVREVNVLNTGITL